MRWKFLLPILGLVLLAALAFALWPTTGTAVDPTLVALPAPLQPTAPNATPRSSPPGAPAPTAAPVAAPAPALAPPTELGVLDPVPDPDQVRALGLDPDEVIEPVDGGPLHAISRDGIKGAVKEKLPEIKECYESWLQQDPTISGRMKVEFQIMEIPGRDRAKVMAVTVADGGLGHLAMEGCVRNVFKSMRFEAPRGGEVRVSYPLSFESHPDQDGGR